MSTPIPFKLASINADVFTKYIDSEEFPININLLFKLRPDIELELATLENGVLGYNYKSLDDKWRIVVNENIPYSQKRHVVAHELFHIISNEPMCDSRSSSPLGGNKPLNEHAADQFADELLMPASLFKKYWVKYNKDLDYIARLTQSPIEAVERRILMLGLK